MTMGYIRSVEYDYGIYQKCGIRLWDISEVWNMTMGYIRSVEYDWHISEDFQFINIVLLKSDTRTL